MVVIYQYTGTKTLVLPGYGKWLKIKSGDTIVVARHIECKGCGKCPGKAVIVDPPGISGQEGICFLNHSDLPENSEFPLAKVMELRTDKREISKNKGRLLRPFD